MRGSETFNEPVVYDVWRVRRDLLMEIWLLQKAGGYGLKSNGFWRSARLGGVAGNETLGAAAPSAHRA